MTTKKNINNTLVFLLILFSYLINRHYSNFGLEAGDTFVLYNGGYKVLNGLVPFKDYWLTTGPLMDYFNAFFFSIGEVSWSTYTTHSSFFNVLITLTTFFFLKNFKLNIYFCFLYTIFFSILMYPVVGTPFVDHHSTIFLLVSFYVFIIAIKNEKYEFFSFIPLLLLLSFLCKQTPASYGIIAITFLTILSFLLLKNYKIIKYSFIGIIIAIIFFISFIFITDIPIDNFLIQYILFGSSIGSYRISTFSFSFFGILHQYKFIFIQLIFLIFMLSKLFFEKKLVKDIILILSIILLSLILLFHQFLTLNENFIFFLIPLITAINHSYYNYLFNKNNNLKIILILFCIFSVFKYHIRFNENRKFHTLEKVDLSKSIDAKNIDQSLEGLKWISYRYKNDPAQEISGINNAIKILSGEDNNYMLITNYLFLSPILKTRDYSPNQWHHPGVSFPLKERKYHEDYKNFFSQSLKKNKIKKIYIVGKEAKDILYLIYDKSCFEYSQLGYFTYKFQIKNTCQEINENH